MQEVYKEHNKRKRNAFSPKSPAVEETESMETGSAGSTSKLFRGESETITKVQKVKSTKVKVKVHK